MRKRTPEQRANISRGTARGMNARSAEDKERWRQKLRDAHVCSVYTPRGRPNLTIGHRITVPADAIAKRAATQRMAVSIKQIIREITEQHRTDIRQAILDGINAPPPRSYPYLALAAAYLDGRPTDQPATAPVDTTWLQYLTDDQLEVIGTWIRGAKARAALDEQRGQTTSTDQPLVIDAVAVREPEEVER